MVESKPVLLLIATGPRLYREYLLRSISARYRVFLISAAEPDWALPYLEDAVVAPAATASAVLAAARRLAARLPVAGVMTWAEDYVLPTAVTAEELRLPGPAPAAVLRCRDKSRTRAALSARGVRQPASVPVADLSQALAAAGRLGYPVVLKPQAGVASEGVVLVDGPAQLADEFPATLGVPAADMPELRRAVLVEEYVTGPEISVDSVVQGGRVTPVFVARKETGFEPYFEETGHTVSAADPLLSDPRLRRELEDVHAALGYTDGCTHAELRLCAEGPTLIEVNARLGGDLIPYLGMRASGIDPGLAAAAVACGEAPDLTLRAASFAGIRFFYPPGPDTVIQSVDFDRTDLPAELDVLAPLAAAGDVVSPPGRGLMEGRIALATAVASSAERRDHALDRADAALRCTWHVRAAAQAGQA
jgi:predicted ATP-grasp superfamily ATP-dependent carboligase